MTTPRVSFDVDLRRIIHLGEEDPPLAVRGWSTIYLVEPDPDGGEQVTPILIEGHHLMLKVEPMKRSG